MNQLTPARAHRAPALVAVGPRASYRFLEFFTAQIRNPHTRRRLCARRDGKRPLLGEMALAGMFSDKRVRDQASANVRKMRGGADGD